MSRCVLASQLAALGRHAHPCRTVFCASRNILWKDVISDMLGNDADATCVWLTLVKRPSLVATLQEP